MDRSQQTAVVTPELPLLPVSAPEPVRVTPRHAHDIKALALEVQREYFPNVKPLPIKWGRRGAGRQNRQSIRLGSYHHRTTVIRIHPTLDTPIVPAYFIQSIIHHEYLHHILGPSHGRRFHAHERKFRYYTEAHRWLKANLMMLLGRRKNTMPQARKPKARVEQLALF